MTDEIKFSEKLAKSIKLDELKKQDKLKEKAKLDQISGIFDENDDSEIDISELSIHINKIDKDKDGKITKEEIENYFDELDLNSEVVTKQDFIDYVKAVAKQNEEVVKDASNAGNGYTIQLGEQLDDLVERVLKTHGVDSDDEEYSTKFENCKKSILENNPKAFATDKGGNYKWLIAGAKIYLPTDTFSDDADVRVKDQDNYDDVVADYKKWQSGEISNFNYKIDDDGKRYRVSGGTETEITTAGTTTASADDEEKTEDIVDTSKITDAACVDQDDSNKKYDVKTVKKNVEAGLKIISGLSDDNIKSCTPSDKKHENSMPEYYNIELKSGEKAEVYCDEDGNITDIAAKDKDDNYLCCIDKDNLYVDVEGEKSNKYDIKIEGAVKDFDKMANIVKSCSNFTDKQNETTEEANKPPYDIYEKGTELGKTLYETVENMNNHHVDFHANIVKVNEENIFNVVGAFNDKSPKEHIIEYLVRENSQVEGSHISYITRSMLKCAETHGLKDTKEYKNLKEYHQRIDSGGDYAGDITDADWAKDADKALEALRNKIKEAVDKAKNGSSDSSSAK